MSKKLTIEFIKGEFEKEGCILLSTKYINNKQRLKYICSNKHNSTVRWGDWQQGKRCRECSGYKKLTIEFVRQEFKKEGYTLLSKKYINCGQKLNYICSKGHRGSISWDNWKQGCRCAECAGCKKYTIEFIRVVFEKEKHILLTKKYKNVFQKLEYVCPKGHKGFISWSNWAGGHRCSKCFYENNKGKNHCRWNPELTNEDRINGRHISGYVEWACFIKERDNFTCQACGKHGGNLVSHHLESYNNSLNLRTALSNGICLCENCHKNFHHQYGYGNNTRKQFEKFKLNVGVQLCASCI